MGADALYHTAIFNEQYDEDGNEAVIKYFNNWVIGLKSNLSKEEKTLSFKKEQSELQIAAFVTLTLFNFQAL